MKTSIKLVLVYALLLVLLSLTLSSCFLFQKHTTKSSSSTDSTAYSKIESSYTKKAEEAWNNYLINLDSSSSKVYFYDGNEPQWVKIDTDGSIEAKGNIKEVVHKSGKQTTKKDSGSKKSVDSTKYINTTYTVVKTVTLNKTKTVERKPDYWGYFKIGAVLLLIVAVVRKWASIKAKVISFGKGLFTNFFS